MGTDIFINESEVNNFLENYFQEHLNNFRLKSNLEIVDCFNREVGCNGWTGTRGAYLEALSRSFRERDLILDETVFLKGAMSIKRKVKLEGNKVVPIDD